MTFTTSLVKSCLHDALLKSVIALTRATGCDLFSPNIQNDEIDLSQHQTEQCFGDYIIYGDSESYSNYKTCSDAETGSGRLSEKGLVQLQGEDGEASHVSHCMIH